MVVIENGSPKLVGLMSWGIGCNRPHFYTVYTRTSAYELWIENTVEEMRKKGWLLKNFVQNFIFLFA